MTVSGAWSKSCAARLTAADDNHSERRATCSSDRKIMLWKRYFLAVPWKIIVINVVLTTSSRLVRNRSARDLSQFETKEVDCGVPVVKPNVFSRIVGGTEAIAHSFPWQTSILMKSFSWKHFCGGSIIARRCILTAAHCVYNYEAKDFRVLVGGHNRNSTENVSLIELESIFVHENYTGRMTQWKNDIAIISLRDEIVFNTFAQPVCLGRTEVPEGSQLVATGWGKTGDGESSPLLNQVVVPLYSRTKCKTAYPNFLSENMICAGYEEGKRDSCQGDSGGPLVRYSSLSGKWTLQGITSVGSACAAPRKPGIYTSVPAYYDWIQSRLSDLMDKCKSKRTNNCEHFCHNTIEGGYVCSCNDGYSLEANGYQCRRNDVQCGQPLPAFVQRRRRPPPPPPGASAAESPALPHSYLSVVSISYKWENWIHRCSGCIVAPRWILTTATCLYSQRNAVLPANEVRVLAGVHRLFYLNGTEQEMFGEETFIHEDFDSTQTNSMSPSPPPPYGNNKNNIGLIRLSSAVAYGNHVSAVCLPNQKTMTTVDYTSCRRVGWTTTKTTNSEDLAKTVLMERFLQPSEKNCYFGVRNATADAVCAAALADNEAAEGQGRTEAGGSTGGACRADPGGPLLCLAGGRVAVLGLTISKRCLQPDDPFYTFSNIADHSDWINRIMTTT